MKLLYKSIVISAVSIIGTIGNAQIIQNIKPNIDDTSNAFMDASQNVLNVGESVGRGLSFPETDLSVFRLNGLVLDGINFPNYYDGMLVYNTASGSTTDPNIVPTNNLTPGFYYFSNPKGKTNGNTSEGQWVKIAGGDNIKVGKGNGHFWSLEGNENIDDAINFIGTTDEKSLVFKTNNIARLTIGGKDGALSERVGTKADKFNFVLKVYGKARFSEGIVTEASTYPDYVFDNYFTGKSDVNPDYKFKKLNEVEAFIKENNHLPGVTKIDDLAKTESGYEVDNTKLSIQTLEKVEELYLHLIEQQKEIQALKAQIAELKK